MTPYALVIGESLIDVVEEGGGRATEHPGGSAANVAVALARLGRPVRFATSFADDPHGRLLAEHLAASGVELAADPHVVRRTSTATATINSGGAASYAFDVDWRLGEVRMDPTPVVVHVSSFGAVLEPGATSVRAAVAALRGRAVVSYDINLRAAVTGAGPEVRDRVLELVSAADLVKASDDDLAELFGTSDVEPVARELLERGPAAVVVTRGGEGATCFLPGGRSVRADVVPVRVADTIGAGDTFSAAMIDALWDSLATPSLGETNDLAGSGGTTRPIRWAQRAAAPGVWQQVLEYAARVAAVTVSRPGADPPHRRDLDT
ncbi:ribokinase [Nocardioides sp. Soil797]|nr:ribokinase [Nocardioides sp. Soil797]